MSPVQRLSGQQQLSSLAAQVTELSEINTTLKRYLEALLTSEAPEKSKDLISTESERLQRNRLKNLIVHNPLIHFLVDHYQTDLDAIIDAMVEATSFKEFLTKLVKGSSNLTQKEARFLLDDGAPFDDFNKARSILDLTPIPLSDDDPVDGVGPPVKAKSTARVKKAKIQSDQN